MRIVAELSAYPIKDDAIPDIIRFIQDLRSKPGLEIVTNQMSTQLRGEFGDVTAAINETMRKAMEEQDKLLVVAKYLNIDLPVASTPHVTG